MTQPYKRRQLIVNKQLQSRIITAVSWPAGVCIMGTTAMMGLFYAKLAQQALLSGVDLDGTFAMLIFAMAFILGATLFFLYSSLKVSHRVAGPIFSIKRTLQQIRAGDRTLRANIRRKDFLHDLTDELNEFLDWAEEYLPKGTEPSEQPAAEKAEPVTEA